MDRRTFLSCTSALTASTLLAGCQSPNSPALRLRVLRGSIPALLPREFSKQLPPGQSVQLDVKPESQLQGLFEQLQTWKRQTTGQAPPPPKPWVPLPIPWIGTDPNAAIADLVSLGDAWLAVAIRQKLIQPFDVAAWQQQDPSAWQAWQTLETPFRTLVQRNDRGGPDPQGAVWGMPYGWGSTVIAYRKDIFEQKQLPPPQDWSDLWRSDLHDRISLLDQPREVIGLTLKKLGHSYNLTDLSQLPKLLPELRQLQHNVRFYSSTDYLQPLILGDTWVAVGWSTDVLAQMRRNPNLAVVFPRSGTALWADLWVRPAAGATTAGGAKESDLIAQWVSFCLQPTIAPQLSLITQATSPTVLRLPPEQLPSDLRQNAVLCPEGDRWRASEFLLPLPEATVAQYRSLWEALRQTR